MFRTLGWFVVRRRRWVLAATALAAIAAALAGSGVLGKLGSGGFDDPTSESSRAKAVLEQRFGAGDPNLVLLVHARDGRVDSGATRTAGTSVANRLGAVPGVESVASYWQLGSPATLRSRDGASALVLARVEGSDQRVADAIDRVRTTLTGQQNGVDVQLGGQQAVAAEVGRTVKSDLSRAESIAIPLTLLLLIVVFGSVVAASLPLAVGGIAIVGTLATLALITTFTDVSIFSINLTTALGLGLAIDYSLFIVSRFREELATGLSTEDAVVRTVEHAGRTVAFSALTVAVSLAALLVFPLYFLRSFAYAGAAVVVIAALAATVSLPALLAVLGPRVNAGRIGRKRRAAVTTGEGFWHRMATRVMRRPLPIATAAIALLVFLGVPFLSARFGLIDERVLPASASTRVTATLLRTQFASNESNAFGVVLTNNVGNAALNDYASRISRLDGVTRVDARDGSFADGVQVAGANRASARFTGSVGTWISVVPSVAPESSQGEALVHAIRNTQAPAPALVGGASAELVDTKHSIVSRLPLAGGIIAITTFVLLFLMFGSVLVPTKAVLLNLLSLTATFGAMVWIFQEGHGSGVLGFTATGTLNATIPILMFCIAFGLSMDYEVFLLSRIKEEHDRTGDNERSIAVGLERTGRIVTTAAALLAVTFLSFATSGVSFIKLFGIGLAVAVVVDATVVRATLVPAFMKLAGDANWWAPPPLRRLYERVGLHESATESVPTTHAVLTGECA
jgi:RND superfamily putative drug exporter